MFGQRAVIRICWFGRTEIIECNSPALHGHPDNPSLSLGALSKRSWSSDRFGAGTIPWGCWCSLICSQASREGLCNLRGKSEFWCIQWKEKNLQKPQIQAEFQEKKSFPRVRSLKGHHRNFIENKSCRNICCRGWSCILTDGRVTQYTGSNFNDSLYWATENTLLRVHCYANT